MSDKTIADVLSEHLARMRAISEADRKSSARLAALHNLLIYRTATSSLKADAHIDNLVEQIVLESANASTADLPSNLASGPTGIVGGLATGTASELGAAEVDGGA